MYGLPQISMMMILGLYVFGMKTTPYQQLQKQIGWRHPSTSRVGKSPARQFIGKGDSIITLSGVLYPELTGGKISLMALEMMGDSGKAWPLIEGTGLYYGLYVIEGMTQTDSIFFPDGAPRKIEFSMKLTRVDDDPNMLGILSNALLGALNLK